MDNIDYCYQLSTMITLMLHNDFKIELDTTKSPLEREYNLSANITPILTRLRHRTFEILGYKIEDYYENSIQESEQIRLMEDISVLKKEELLLFLMYKLR